MPYSFCMATHTARTEQAVTERLTAVEMKTLCWYVTRANHGRGRILVESSRLIKRGFLRLAWTGPRTWVITITEHGRNAAEQQSIHS